MNRILPTLVLLTLLTSPLPAAEPSPAQIESALKQIAQFEPGQNRTPLTVLSDAVQAAASPEQKATLEKQLIRFLEGDATRAGQTYVTKQLSRIATDASVPLLAKRLVNPESSDSARYALEGIQGNAAAQALRNALNTTTGAQKIGVISSLGQRKDAAATPLIAPLIFDSNPDIAAASVAVLGQIATPQAVQALTNAGTKTEGTLRESIFDALLQSADTLADDGNTTTASRVYKNIFTANAPGFIRSAALRGLVLSVPDQSMALLRKAMRSRDPEIQSVAISLAAESKADGMTELLVKELPRLPPDAQSQLLSALGQRGDKTALPAVIKLVNGNDPALRLIALDGLAALGDDSTVPLLLNAAANSSGQERSTARNSLYRLRGTTVDQAIISHLVTGDTKVRIEVVRAIGQRRITSAIGPLLIAARDPEPGVRSQSLKVLGEFTTLVDLPDLVQLLVDAPESSDRSGAEKALTSLLRRHNNDGLESILITAQRATDIPTRASLYAIAGNTQDPKALPTLQQGLKDPSPEIRKTAIRALADWPTPTPMPALLDAASTDQDNISRILALRGYIKLAGIKSERTNSDTVALLAQAMKIAERSDEKRSILALLPRFASPEALELAQSVADNPDLATEAQSAINAIKEAQK